MQRGPRSQRESVISFEVDWLKPRRAPFSSLLRAAVPLGLCLLPAFVLIGIVPLVVALVSGLDL